MITISLCLSDIPKEKIKKADNGKLYINLCVTKRKEPTAYGVDYNVMVSKTKEEREAKAETIYCGSGIEYKPKPEAPITPQAIDEMQVAEEIDDLPF
jgi:hypothetical protein